MCGAMTTVSSSAPASSVGRPASRRIAAANPELLTGEPDRLTPGWRLVIPDAEQPPALRSVVVERGETLSAIADRLWSDADRWPQLYEANRFQLDDPDELPVGLTLVLPAEEVPAGRYARDALDAAGVSVASASLEQDVRAALSKVELGEADASLVYGSDVAATSDAVQGVDIPAEDNVTASYPVATLADATDPAAAEAFVELLLSEDGQRILAAHGFMGP